MRVISLTKVKYVIQHHLMAEVKATRPQSGGLEGVCTREQEILRRLRILPATPSALIITASLSDFGNAI